MYKTLDYVRYSSLELAAREIYENNVAGNVAELGVYQGDFAQYINQAFPDRKLYLFDTFEGFNESDINNDRNNQYCIPDNAEYEVKDTSVDIVLNKMVHKEQCIIKKRIFPPDSTGH